MKQVAWAHARCGTDLVGRSAAEAFFGKARHSGFEDVLQLGLVFLRVDFSHAFSRDAEADLQRYSLDRLLSLSFEKPPTQGCRRSRRACPPYGGHRKSLRYQL
ncbi:hypothetical protein D3C79_854410 [compost metagenome]